MHSRLRSRKIFLILTKFTPHLIGLIYIIYTIAQFLEFDLVGLGYLSTLTFLPWLNLYSASWALEFCYVHRLPLYYVAIDEILLVVDQYYGIPLNVYELLLLHLVIIGLFIFGYTYYYVKNYKRNINIVSK